MVEFRHCEQHQLIQTSAVVVLRPVHGQCPAVPPPSPPSPPISPPERELCEPLEQLSLGPPAESEPYLHGQGHEHHLQHHAHGQTHSYVPGSPSLKADRRLTEAVHVLNTEATALRNLTHLYETDPIARDGFNRSVEALTRLAGDRGKLVVIGVGKSGHIGKKLVATFNSLAIHAVFLHPTEALHGDLGMIGRYDTLLVITFSGKTSELLSLIPHLDARLPTILLTSHTRPDSCEFFRLRPDTILLPAPIHEPETVSFGVCAPTTSTTMALAVGDALAIAAAKELHHSSVPAVFAQNHPGGAIGASFRRPQKVRDLAVPWADIVDLNDACGGESLGADVLRAGYDSPSGWVRLHDGVASPARIRRLRTADLTRSLREIPRLLVMRGDMLSVSADTSLRRAADLVRSMQLQPLVEDEEEQQYVCDEDSILAVMDKGEIIGVIEVGELLAWKDA